MAIRVAPKNIACVHELDALSVIQAQLALITKQLGAANVSAIQTPTSACNSCGGHTNDDCQDTTFLRSLKTNMQTTLTTSNDLTIPTPIHTTPDGETTQIFLGATTS